MNSPSEQEKEIGLEEASTVTMHNWVMWCRSKKGAYEICSFQLNGNEIFSNQDKTTSKEEHKNKNGSQQKGTSRAERTIQVMVEARQHQNGNETHCHFDVVYN